MTDERRTPEGLRWVRSGNDVLHAAPNVLSGRVVVTPCGLDLRRMAWSPFAGQVPHYVLDRAAPPICKHCDQIVEWLDPEGAAPGASAEPAGVDPGALPLAPQAAPGDPAGGLR